MITTLLPILVALLLRVQVEATGAAAWLTKPTLATHEFSLSNRYADPGVNRVFKDNILLTLAILDKQALIPEPIDWEALEKPFTVRIALAPGEIFAFHEALLPEFNDKQIIAIPAHYNATDGFKSDGWLYGDGVCHLASLLYWVARDAGLGTVALTNHNFAPIPDVPREYGVSIYSNPFETAGSARQNLYITNTRENPIEFTFAYDGGSLLISVADMK